MHNKHVEEAERIVCQCSEDGRGRFADTSEPTEGISSNHHDTCPIYHGTDLVNAITLSLHSAVQKEREEFAEAVVKELKRVLPGFLEDEMREIINRVQSEDK